ncbi:hypothetical protein SCOR_29615 [Sulfidibacter corallicola]
MHRSSRRRTRFGTSTRRSLKTFGFRPRSGKPGCEPQPIRKDRLAKDGSDRPRRTTTETAETEPQNSPSRKNHTERGHEKKGRCTGLFGRCELHLSSYQTKKFNYVTHQSITQKNRIWVKGPRLLPRPSSPYERAIWALSVRKAKFAKWLNKNTRTNSRNTPFIPKRGRRVPGATRRIAAVRPRTSRPNHRPCRVESGSAPRGGRSARTLPARDSGMSQAARPGAFGLQGKGLQDWRLMRMAGFGVRGSSGRARKNRQVHFPIDPSTASYFIMPLRQRLLRPRRMP